jgi:demethylmenaquinone methyltransferase / 2-methoxy-6-polyprenyl-1,4-benzoquinol methylase
MTRTTDTSSTFGFDAVPPEERQGRVNAVFSSVASRYDLMNDLMSGGLHRLWKDDLVSWLAPPPARVARKGWRHLDVAGGTGDVARRVVALAGDTSCSIVCDISQEMMLAGRDRPLPRAEAKGDIAGAIFHVAGNAEALPFADQTFDAVTIAFGIRNVTHIDRALSEMRRVLKFGGRFICLEFSEVTIPVLDSVYDAWSFHAIPRLGQLAAGDAESYRYLVESIRRFPRQEAFAEMIRTAGLERVSYRNLTGGVAAMHSAWRL